MAKRANDLPPALKHGIYSGMTLLPGEDPTDFEKFRSEIFAEYEPTGRSEEDIVTNLASLMWRRQNLLTYRFAECARKKHSSIHAELNLLTGPMTTHELIDQIKMEEREAKLDVVEEQADNEARAELGPAYELVELGDVATTDYLLRELEIIDRLDTMIDRGLKRLLYIRGVKSMPRSSSGEVRQARIRDKKTYTNNSKSISPAGGLIEIEKQTRTDGRDEKSSL